MAEQDRMDREYVRFATDRFANTLWNVIEQRERATEAAADPLAFDRNEDGDPVGVAALAFENAVQQSKEAELDFMYFLKELGVDAGVAAAIAVGVGSRMLDRMKEKQ